VRSGWGRLETLVAVVGIAGAAVVGVSVPHVSLAALLWALFAVALAEAFASHLRDGVDVSLMNVAILVVLLVGHVHTNVSGWALATIATLGAVPALISRIHSGRLQRVTFNAGQFALSAAAAGAMFTATTSLLGATFPDLGTLVAITLAALAYSIANHLLVAIVIAVSHGEPMRSSLRSLGPSLAMQVPYVGIAVLAAVILLRASPWALLLMAVPTLIARYGLLAFQRLDESYDRLVRSFVKAIEIKDLYTRGHSERVAQLSVHVAEELGVPYDERRLTRYAALLHDVGKIGVPLCIINKPGPLDDDEFEAIKQHPSIGADILHDIDFLAPAIDIVRYHHERLDGRGYPHGVGEEELSDIVRIVTAVDAFDAMTSTRSYRRALAVADALAELRRCAGRQFDPRMVEALASVVDRIGWAPTIEFASEQHLHGEEIPLGTAQERLGHDTATETCDAAGTPDGVEAAEASEVRP
jgi:putative nucleotidyltransferase with HDIG domain